MAIEEKTIEIKIDILQLSSLLVIVDTYNVPGNPAYREGHHIMIKQLADRIQAAWDASGI